MSRRIVLVLLAVVLTLGFAQAAGARAPLTYPVTSTTFTFVDTTRATPRNGTFPGAPTRTIPTLVLSPSGPAAHGHKFPLIVFSPGFTATGPDYAPVLTRWAARGFIVAAVTFPLSNRFSPGGGTIFDYPNQPGDVSFVITQMLRVDPEVDAHSIGVAGHSLGAITTLGVAYNSCCIDPRIDAAVPISGIMLPFGPTGGTFFNGPHIPLLLVHGNNDDTVPYGASVNSYAAASAPKYFLTLLGAPHTPFRPPWDSTIDNTITTFFDRYLNHAASGADIIAAGNQPGIATMQADVGAPLGAHGP